MGRFLRITHPSATRQRPEGPVTVRLACVRHAASVQSEPGSNSSVNDIRLLLGQPILLRYKSKDLYRGSFARFSPTQAPTQIAWFSGLLKSAPSRFPDRGRQLYRPPVNRQHLYPRLLHSFTPGISCGRGLSEARIIRGFRGPSIIIFTRYGQWQGRRCPANYRDVNRWRVPGAPPHRHITVIRAIRRFPTWIT